jgi:hypothetical protein
MNALNSGCPSQGVDLNSADEPRVHALGQFHNFGQLLTLRERGDHQTCFAQSIQVIHIGFIARAAAPTLPLWDGLIRINRVIDLILLLPSW